MRPQQPLAFPQRFAYQPDLAVLQITQAAMDDSTGTAGGACSEIVFFHQKGAFAAARTLLRSGDAIDAAAHHDDIEVAAVQPGTLRPHTHPRLAAWLSRFA